MAGKTLIGGTAYDISGGKTLVNGTAYSIAGGKTLIDGTAYDISFGVDLAELFRGMTVLRTAGSNGSSRRTLSLSPPSTFPVGSTAYAFSFCNGSMGIFKVRRADSIQQIYGNVSGGGGLSMDNSGQLCYYDNFDSTVDSDASYTNVYGATLALVQFDQSEAKVDAVLSKLQHVAHDGKNSSSSTLTFIDGSNISVGNFVFVAYNTDFAINIKRESGEMENIWSNNVNNPTLLHYYSNINQYYLNASGNNTDTYNYGCSIHAVQGG